MQRKKRDLLRKDVPTAFILCLMFSCTQASQPLWTFEPQTPTDITVVKGSSQPQQIIYTVRNQSSKSKRLFMKPIIGISQSTACQLSPKGICTLALSIDGSLIKSNVVGGPVLCEQGNQNQCYQPSTKDSLHIKFTQNVPAVHTAFGIYLSSDNNLYPMLAQSTDGGSNWYYKLDSVNTLPIGFVEDTIFVGTSCSERICIAAANVLVNNITYPMVIQSTDGGSQWSYKLDNTTALPENFSDYAQFFSASCSGSTCVVAGVYQAKNTKMYPMLAVTEDAGRAWTYKLDSNTILPIDFSRGPTSFQSTSCSGSTCTAVGSYYAAGGAEYPLLALSSDAGNHWTYKLQKGAVMPADFVSGRFSSTSCSGSTCTAAGSYFADDGPEYPLLALSSDAGNHWTYKLQKGTVMPGDFVSGRFSSTSCSGSTCTAAGSYYAADGDEYPLLALSSDAGNHWTYKLQKGAVMPGDFVGGRFSSTSCSGSTCTVAGSYDAANGYAYPLLAFSSDAGKHWTYKLQKGTVLPGGFMSEGNFTTTSCSNTICTAGGSYVDSNGTIYPMLAQSMDGGSNWSYKLDRAILPSGFTSGSFFDTSN